MNTGRAGVALAAWACVLAGAAFVGWNTFRPDRTGPVHDPRPNGSVVREVAGFEVRLTALGLGARLAPLHSDPARQAFETRALRTRLALGDGEPFCLVLSLDPGAPVLRADGAALRVVSTSGVALVPIVPAVATPADQVADPLRTLLAPGTIELAAGRSTSLVLWGRLDGPAPELHGLPSGPCALAPARWPADELEGVLARLSAREPGEAGR